MNKGELIDKVAEKASASLDKQITKKDVDSVIRPPYKPTMKPLAVTSSTWSEDKYAWRVVFKRWRARLLHSASTSDASVWERVTACSGVKPRALTSCEYTARTSAMSKAHELKGAMYLHGEQQGALGRALTQER